MKTAERLLNKHITVSKVVTLFNDLALKSMRYSEFKYDNNKGNPIVTIKGDVGGYNSVIEQGRVFSESNFITSTSLGGFLLGDNGRVTLNFTINLDPKIVSYKDDVQPVSINQ